MTARDGTLKFEKTITLTKNFMSDNEMSTDRLLEAINHLYLLLCKRKGDNPNIVRGNKIYYIIFKRF